MSGCIGLDHMCHTGHDIIQVDPSTDRTSFLNCVPNSANDILGTASVFRHVHQNLAKCAAIILSFIDEKHPCVRVGYDCRQRLIQFVGERSCHLAKQTDPAEKVDPATLKSRLLFASLPPAALPTASPLPFSPT